MKIAVVVTGGLHPSGRDQVVPSWLALFSELARTHDIHAFALRHLPEAQTYQLLGFTVHDLGRPSAAFGLTRHAQARALTRALSTHGPFDLIHGLWGDPAGQLAVHSARRLGVPSLVTMDSGEFVSIPEIDYGSQRTARGRKAIQDACGASRIHVCTQFMAASGRSTWCPADRDTAHVRAGGCTEADAGIRSQEHPAAGPSRKPQPRQEPADADRCAADGPAVRSMRVSTWSARTRSAASSSGTPPRQASPIR